MDPAGKWPQWTNLLCLRRAQGRPHFHGRRRRQLRKQWRRYQRLRNLRSRNASTTLRTAPRSFSNTGTDCRVHVVGNQVFGCEIASAADDYRYPQDAPTSLSACEVPPQIADQCRQVSRSLNLPVTGIDLRRTPAGEWYCFEVNPSPGFSFYEEATGQPISDAIADLLLLRVN